MSEKLCLQWNDFQENIKRAFGSLREDNNFADVTLACEDDQQVEAHKVILAASSPFFQKLLGRNKHPHPLIYMRWMKYEDLLAIVEFLYRGEANVFQENLDSFLAIAEELQLKGLMGKTDENVEEYKGLGYRSPLMASIMVLLLVSLTGLPPTAGFIGKVYLFAALIESKSFYWLALVGILNSVVSLFYYFNIIAWLHCFI